MVKKQNKDITKSPISKGSKVKDQRARRINASTVYETCTEQLSPFGGLLGLIKFLDLIKFEEVFEHLYIKPRRLPWIRNNPYAAWITTPDLPQTQIMAFYLYSSYLFACTQYVLALCKQSWN